MENVAVLQSDSIHNKSIKFGVVLLVIIQHSFATIDPDTRGITG